MATFSSSSRAEDRDLGQEELAMCIGGRGTFDPRNSKGQSPFYYPGGGKAVLYDPQRREDPGPHSQLTVSV